jgi:hypothetical protein
MSELRTRISPKASAQGPSTRVRTGSSFLRLLWPFAIARDGKLSHYEEIVSSVQGALGPGGRPLWRSQDLPIDMLLAHCSAYLNCWDGSPRHPRRDHETGHFWQIDKANRAPGAIFDSRSAWLARKGSGEKAASVPLSVTDAHLVIFRQRVGFVVLEIVSGSTEPADWLFLANRLRSLGGSDRRRSSSNGPRLEVQASSVLPFFTHELGQGETNTFSGRLGEVFEWLARESLPGADLTHPWVRDSALPYFSLFVETAEGAPGDESEHPASVTDLGERVRRFFRADQAIHAADEKLAPAAIMYAPNQYLSYSLDGGTFYACDAPDTEFFNHTLPDHLRRYYFLNYLFVLHQRLVLMQMSNAITDRWTGGSSALDRSVGESSEVAGFDEPSRPSLERLVRAFEEIRDELLEFSTRGYFLQFMHSQNHHHDYQRWQETFEVAPCHREVQNQLHEIYAALTLRFEEAVSRRRQQAEEVEHQRNAAQTRVTYVLAIFGVVSLVLAFFGVTIKGVTQRGVDVWTLVIFSAAAAAIGAVIAWVVRRKTLQRDRK